MHTSKSVITLAVALMAAFAAYGQNVSGSLSATVFDQSGAVVPHAKVVLTNEATGAARETVSNGSGFFDFPAIQPGSYRLTVEARGFSVWLRENIVFNQGESRTVGDVTLRVGAPTEHIAVAADAEAISPVDTGESRQSLNSTMVSNLPLDGRDAGDLIKIMPGMGLNVGLKQSAWSSVVTQSNSGPVGQYSANGTQPSGGVTMTMDGANVIDPGGMGGQVANINKDQTAEVTLVNSAFGAEYAKGPVAWEATGKSGTSHFHGSIYGYAHFAALDSTDSYLRGHGGKKETGYGGLYPGGDIGGPLYIPGTNFNRKHDKLFFYIAPEGMEQIPTPIGYAYFVPTPQMLQGNFSPAYLASLGSAFGYAHSGDDLQPTLHGTAAAYPGGMIPQSLLDPNSLAFAKTFPAQFSPLDSGGNNSYYYENLPLNRFEFRIRLDYNISDKTKAFVSWSHQDEFDHYPIGVWWFPDNDLPYPSPMKAHQVSNVLSANITHVFGPTLTNETVATYVRFINPVVLTDTAKVDPAYVGLTGYQPLVPDRYTPQIPNLTSVSWGSVPGYYAPSFGTSFDGGDYGKLSKDPSFADNLSKVAGKHTMKFGVYWDFGQNIQPGGFGLGPQGMVDFGNTGATTTGNPMADFLTGRVQSFQQVTGLSVYNMKFSQYSLYAQDQWRVRRRLTLTYGVRMEHLGQWYPTNGPGIAVWNPAAYNNTAQAGAWTGLLWHGMDSSIPISGYPSRRFFYDPRFGFAFDLFGKGKTVFRGGFGVYRYQISFNTASDNGVYDESANIASYNIVSPTSMGWNFAQYGLPGGAAGLGGNMGALQEGDTRSPYTESYNLILSQQAPWGSLLEIGYYGNRTRDQAVGSNNGFGAGSLGNLNKTPMGAYFLPDPLTGVLYDPSTGNIPFQDYRPYRNYEVMLVTSHAGYSNYNSFQASWNKRAGRTNVMANYTFSKVLGIRDGLGDNGAGSGTTADPWNLKDNYGVLAYDHTQIFNTGYVIALPKSIHGHFLVGGLLNGWALSGMVQLQSGAPIQPNSGGNMNLVTTGMLNSLTWLGTDSATIMPALTCNPTAGLTQGQYFNPNCFALAPRGTNGPAVWPYIHGPHYFKTDLSVYKTFHFAERHQIEFRVSAFNFLNHPLPTFEAGGESDLSLQFATAAAGTTNSNALTTGKPLNTTGFRIVQMTAKYRF
jgi:Carboxypeptidase regulatory-like domain